MVMARYRVVRADGSDTGAMFDTIDEARERRDVNNADFPYWAPYRIQEGEWRDVPVPEPLPDLPESIWVRYSGSGPVATHVHPSKYIAQPSRLFKVKEPIEFVEVSPVGPWTEITETPK